MARIQQGKPSLEHLIETEDLHVEILHPGGLDITRELAELCRISKGASVLEVACGTGETACLLGSKFGARVIGVDQSRRMIQRANEKAKQQGLEIDFQLADAHNLPFNDNFFDAVLSECAVCHFGRRKFEEARLEEVKLYDRSGLMLIWTKDFKKRMGVWGYIRRV